jgi:hypothetical protein
MEISMKNLLFVIIFVGFIIRVYVLCGVNWTNSSDLNNYFWAASRMAAGESAYRLWAQNLAGPRADLLPFELVIMSAIVRVWPSPEALRWFFLVFDLINIMIVWDLFHGNRIRQLTWSILYSCWPSTIYFFTMTPSDKPIIIAGLLGILWLIKKLAPSKSYRLSVFLVGFLAAFKWFGLFIAVPVAYACSRRRFLMFFVFLIGVMLIFSVSHALWFPDWLVVYHFRSMRFGPPFHSSLGVLLQEFGISISSAYFPLMLGSWFLVQVLCLINRLRPSLAIVLSLFSILIWAPDTTAQMLFMLTLNPVDFGRSRLGSSSMDWYCVWEHALDDFDGCCGNWRDHPWSACCESFELPQRPLRRTQAGFLGSSSIVFVDS